MVVTVDDVTHVRAVLFNTASVTIGQDQDHPHRSKCELQLFSIVSRDLSQEEDDNDDETFRLDRAVIDLHRVIDHLVNNQLTLCIGKQRSSMGSLIRSSHFRYEENDD